jgi:H+/Cl- antiporter ClcA
LTAASTPPSLPDPGDLLRDRRYAALLLFGALVGAPIAVFAYFFLKAVNEGQSFFFTDLPKHLGFHTEPVWWPLFPLALAGVVVSLTIRYLPGTGGHSPADGFKPAGAVASIELPGILLAALATLCLGPALGPEAPLIALGAGFGALVVHVLRRDAPAMASVVIGAAGSFAAVSVLFGSPISAAFLLMEASGLGGGLISVMLLPGLLAAGIGTLIFVGLNSWVGFGTFSLAVSSIPHFGTPNGVELLWAVGIGLGAAVLGTGVRQLALFIRPAVQRRILLLTPVLGLAIAGLAIAFAEGSNKSSSEVLFSGQTSLPPLIQHSATWTVGALVLVVVCKSFAYVLSLAGFRGGPTFPAMFIGAAGGIALSHAPRLPMIAGAAIGMGAMIAAVLGLPLTSVLITSLLLQADALSLIPLIIVGVVVSYVVSARLAPHPRPRGSVDQPANDGRESDRGSGSDRTSEETGSRVRS